MADDAPPPPPSSSTDADQQESSVPVTPIEEIAPQPQAGTSNEQEAHLAEPDEEQKETEPESTPGTSIEGENEAPSSADDPQDHLKNDKIEPPALSGQTISIAVSVSAETEQDATSPSAPDSVPASVPVTPSLSSFPTETPPAASSRSTVADDDVANENATVSPTRTGRRSRRSPSLALSASNITVSGQTVVSSSVFIKKALTAIKAHKSTSNFAALDGSVSKALSIFNDNELPPPSIVFEPLRIVCSQSSSNDLKVIALDCIGKLFSFSYLVDAASPTLPPASSGITPPPRVPIIDRAIKTVCDCFQGESTDPKVELQIIKALMAAVLNDDLIAHGATLLRAIRQTYTIFVMSHKPTNQATAQATLSQMIGVIFDRVKSVIKTSTHVSNANNSVPSLVSSDNVAAAAAAAAASEASATPTPSSLNGNKLTLRQMENMGSTNELERVKEEVTSAPTDAADENDLFAKDAFLVFRTLCRLSEKTLEGDSLDNRSHGMRSKLLSLHLIHTILKSHMSLFLSNEVLIRSNLKGNETFLLSVKDYICSTLARNAASINPAVFEISTEIFFLIVSNLRFQFKKEIEVFFAEIYFPITEMKTSTYHQKQYFLSIVQKLSNDPRALVEIYLNYDCDASSSLNIYEQLIDFLVKLAVTPVHLNALQLLQFQELKNRPIAEYMLSASPTVAISNFQASGNTSESLPYPIEHPLKMTALESLVAVLRSLLTWSQRGIAAVSASMSQAAENGEDQQSSQTGEETPVDNDSKSLLSATGSATVIGDDPSQFQNLKIKKTAFQEAIRQFNVKPKRGIKALIASGIIENSSPEGIASFLLTTEGLDKALIGEYLGEGDPENIAIMHAFVDLMDFSSMKFVDALRRFLQAFRLPGEAQKIDRYMLKFAERYILGNPGVFANADTGYVLAYSVIMLNTDLHSPQVKNRMAVDDFLRNNRGINDGQDLDKEYLADVYNEIRNNEIKLLSEQHAALLSSDGQQTTSGGFAANLSNALVGRDLQREAYLQASREMANKTEQVFKDLISSDGKRRSEGTTFYIASHIEHIKPMFEVAWMSFLAGLSGPFQQSEDPDVIKLCLEGFKLSIRIACLFDIDLARISFVSALTQFTNLQNLSEMKQKNVEAIKQLLQTALSDGNLLKTSWKDILTCISQLERFQLIASGIEAGAIPDVTNARFASRKQSSDTISSARSRTSTPGFFSGLSRHSTQTTHGATTLSANGSLNYGEKPFVYSAELAEHLQSREVALAMDKIFTNSALLSGDAIVDFVRALTEVSAEEIASSGQSEHPRMFSLQKMVDISYYNMERIRFEWSRLWLIMGKQFNVVGCHENTNVVFFALDSLRQLSIRFFDLEELSHFKFQKEFLEPFAYVMANNSNVTVKDMVLQCLQQMVLAKSDRIKSGWKTMFATFSIAAKQPYGHIVTTTYDILRRIYKERLNEVIAQDDFGNLIQCFSDLAKNQKFQKPSLHAVELLKNTISRILELRDQELSHNQGGELTIDFYNRYWFPVLFALHDIIMNGEDLEVRSRALNYMFDTLTEYGVGFTPEFWDTVCKNLLFPTFVVLKNRSEMARFNTQDDMSVWLSTTMIQALRNMIALLSYYFDVLSRMLDGFLDLLTTCINQENDTVSRIGSSCLQQLIQQNVDKFQDEHWKTIVGSIENLFELTTASELFGDYSDIDEPFSTLENGKDITANGGGSADTAGSAGESAVTDGSSISSAIDESTPAPSAGVPNSPSESGNGSITGSPKTMRRKESWSDYNHNRQKRFRKTIVKCILQLLMIDTVDEILQRQETTRPEETNGSGNASHTRTNSSGEKVSAPVPPSALVVRKKVKVVGTEIYDKMPVSELLRILVLLRKSFIFAHRFNSNKELRTNLWRLGFMKQLPNLLKQESLSAHVYISVLIRLYTDEGKLYSSPKAAGDATRLASAIVLEKYDKKFPSDLIAAEERLAGKHYSHHPHHDDNSPKKVTIETTTELKAYVEGQLVPMMTELLTIFDKLEYNDSRAIQAWSPVIVSILEGINEFSQQDFSKVIEGMYPGILGIMNRDMTPTLRLMLQSTLKRVGKVLFKGKSRS